MAWSAIARLQTTRFWLLRRVIDDILKKTGGTRYRCIIRRCCAVNRWRNLFTGVRKIIPSTRPCDTAADLISPQRSLRLSRDSSDQRVQPPWARFVKRVGRRRLGGRCSGLAGRRSALAWPAHSVSDLAARSYSGGSLLQLRPTHRRRGPSAASIVPKWRRPRSWLSITGSMMDRSSWAYSR